jgi:hypothetical protein
MTVQTARNAGLSDLADLLKDQHARKVDIVAPATKIAATEGRIIVTGMEPVLADDGVTLSDGIYLPTDIGDEGIASKLDIPLAYVRRMRRDNVDLWDKNVNGWLRDDPRSFLLRCFKGDEGDGVLRAFLSSKYSTMDNLDALMATLDGVKQAGVQVEIAGCDLTERRMVVRVHCPQVRALAPTLLKGYHSPFSGNSGTDNPVVFAGFVIGNSETGGGAYTITPRIVVEVCTNGMTITKDAMRAVHLGGRLEEGTVEWSTTTQTKAAELIRSKTADAVRTFLTTDYLNATVEQIEAKAGKPVESIEEVKVITKALKFTDAETDGLLSFFIKGGQMTVGGVANAATAYAQEVDDPEVSTSLEAGAARLLIGA